MGRAFEYRKATKFARWDKMAKAFTRAGREIAMAVKSGGPDPDTNPTLRRAIQNAKSAQMPKDRIEAAIKRAGDRDSSNFDEYVFEGMAPHGIAVVVECASDNNQRTVAHVRAAFNKKGGSLGTQGMHDFLFNRVGQFHVPVELIEDVEMLELELIDAGLESLEKSDDEKFYIIQSSFTDFGNMQSALEELKLEVEKSELTRVPTITKSLSEEEVDEVLELIDHLEQDDDVTNVFHNLE